MISNSFQILVLDGGGLKGIFSAAILAYLEDDFGTRIVDHFDLIAGTSTGGIIALGLGMGMSPRDIIKFYIDYGAKIFPNKGLLAVRQLIRSKYESAELKQALQECFNDKILADSVKRLVIPSYNIGENDVYLFKTPHHPRLRRDYKVPVWKVAMATSAAPTFLPVFTDIDNVRLVDGGVWANNPIMIALAEAVSMLNVSLNTIKILSLGTTSEVSARKGSLNHGGLWTWKKDAVDLFLQAQSIGACNQAQHLLGTGKVFRVNPKVPSKLFALDKLSAEELLAKAAHESRHFGPIFQQHFKDHQAEEYIPLYTKKGEPQHE